MNTADPKVQYRPWKAEIAGTRRERATAPPRLLLRPSRNTRQWARFPSTDI